MALSSHTQPHATATTPRQPGGFDIVNPLRRWLDRIEVKNRRFAHAICRVIPCCCPFERTFSVLGREVYIPPLCELNPVYNELVGLRFRALSYLADVCGEDITHYVCVD